MGGPDEELEVTPHRVPRLSLVLLCIAVAVAVTLVLVHRSPTRHRQSGPSPPAPTGPTAAVPTRAAPAPGDLGGLLDVGDRTATVVDAALGGATLYVLDHGQDGYALRAFDAGSRRPIGHIPVRGVPLDLLPFLHVVAGPDEVWLVTEGTAPQPILAFDRGLAHRHDISAAATVYGTAVLSGTLFLATASGVQQVRPGSDRAGAVAGSSGLVAAIAADPDRHRLLAVDASTPLHVLALRPGGRLLQVRSLRSVGVATIAVAGGHVWLGGYTNDAAAVVQLDPDTLRPTAVVSPAARSGGTGTRVSGGGAALWVVSGSPPAEQAWCADAATGLLAGYWIGIAASILSYRGWVYAVTTDGVRYGAAAGCAG